MADSDDIASSLGLGPEASVQTAVAGRSIANSLAFGASSTFASLFQAMGGRIDPFTRDVVTLLQEIRDKEPKGSVGQAAAAEAGRPLN